MLIDLFFKNPIVGIIIFVFIVVAISVHEAAHAFTANYFGDSTPKMQGRLTLNPKAHLDPWGTILIVLIGIGWGKPVVFNPYNLKHPRRDTAIIALAGPVSNIIMAVLAILIINIVGLMGIGVGITTVISLILKTFISLNLALAVFNLIPIEPLDGFKIVAGILPPHLAMQWEDTRRYGFIILIILLLTNTIDRVIFPLISTIEALLYSFLLI